MIASHRKGLMSVVLTNGKHNIVSDVDSSQGGTDEGLNPHELIEAALASCTSLTLELYAKRKEWDIGQLNVAVKIIKEGPDSMITREISFGDIPSEQRVKLLEIASKCPIHKLLISNIKIETHEK